jgi:hypothetical protein
MWVSPGKRLFVQPVVATPGPGAQSGQPQGGWLILIVAGDMFAHGSSRAGWPLVATLGCAAP